MYTQCPECLTIFHVTPDVLAQGHGSVVCGHCTAVFDALRSLHEALPIGIRQLDVHALAQDLPHLDMPVMRPAAPAGDIDGSPLANAPPAPPPSATTPTFARRRDGVPGLPGWAWACAVALLLPLLAGQIAYAARNELLGNTLARPWLERLCATFACKLPLPRDTDSLVLLSRDVRPHPSAPNALIISATLRNDAAFTQAFPSVEITLTDLDENRIAMRRFRPAEYLGDPRIMAGGLAAHASSALVFEVADPGKNAVAYEFKFL
jgi:predicted Zn finger-like uncharacterized protein